MEYAYRKVLPNNFCGFRNVINFGKIINTAGYVLKYQIWIEFLLVVTILEISVKVKFI